MKPEIFAGCSYRGKDKEKIADKFGDFSTVVSPGFALCKTGAVGLVFSFGAVYRLQISWASSCQSLPSYSKWMQPSGALPG
ncbi:MAG: hypothetical protein U0L15_09285, partial [Oscillospiraceae bacterium]|nr:hypothetical protein [Oscillospiraceae bacterium]